jgi:hypothetical protein
MPTAVAKPKATPAQVLEEMAQLTARQLDTVMEGAAVLRLEKRKLVLPTRDSELLRIINRGLSLEKGAKLKELQQKLREETITSREHAQLLRLTEELERLGAERLKALIELAALRKTTVPKLMKEMGLTGNGCA